MSDKPLGDVMLFRKYGHLKPLEMMRQLEEADSRVQAALAPLRKELERLHQPVCKELGELAVNGVCPIHKGDGCLFASGWVEANRALRDMERQRDEAQRQLGLALAELEDEHSADREIQTIMEKMEQDAIALIARLDAAEQQLAEQRKGVTAIADSIAHFGSLKDGEEKCDHSDCISCCLRTLAASPPVEGGEKEGKNG